jgi:hypothetical protein
MSQDQILLFVLAFLFLFFLLQNQQVSITATPNTFITPNKFGQSIFSGFGSTSTQEEIDQCIPTQDITLRTKQAVGGDPNFQIPNGLPIDVQILRLVNIADAVKSRPGFDPVKSAVISDLRDARLLLQGDCKDYPGANELLQLVREYQAIVTGRASPRQ